VSCPSRAKSRRGSPEHDDAPAAKGLNTMGANFGDFQNEVYAEAVCGFKDIVTLKDAGVEQVINSRQVLPG
jgi:hypothetical protein